MLGETRGGDYTIWLVAFLLYALDAARLLSPREMLLVEVGGGRLTAGFSAHPLTLAGRVLAFAPLHRPHRGVFVARWGQAWSAPARLDAALAALGARRAELLPLRLVAVWAFALLFVAGPALTLARGPAAAIVSVAAVVYPTAVAAAAAVWWRRRALGLGAWRCAGLSLELIVCPAFVPNLVRKVTTLSPLEADGAQVLLATASAEAAAQFVARLEARAEELIGETGAEAEAPLRAYLATVRGAR